MVAPMPRNISSIRTHPFMARLARYVNLNVTDTDAIRRAVERELTVEKRKDIVLEGYACDTLHLVEEGFGARYKLLHNGKRQILNIILPGDIIGLPGALFDRAVYSVTSLTRMKFDLISVKEFMDLCYAMPAVGLAMVLLSQDELVLSSDRLIDVGRRTPLERVAHFILELHTSLQSAACTGPNAVTMPLSQEIIGDLLGLSAPHVNRMLRQLREQRLISMRDHTIAIEDTARLQFLAKYEPRTLRDASRQREHR